MNSFGLLLRSTSNLYIDALKKALKTVKLYWWLAPAQLIAAGLIAIPIGILVNLLGIVGSFAAGLALAFVVAVYLASMRAVHMRDSLRGILPSGQALFFPVIHVLFLFFVLNLLLSAVVSGPNSDWVRACIGMLITVFGNVLPELIYVRGSSNSEMFTESFEFIIENWIEWFLPALPFVLLLFVLIPQQAPTLLVRFFQTHPLELLEGMVFLSSSMLFSPSFWVILVVIAYVFFFIAVFRAALFEELFYSSRRKRVYSARMSG